MKITLRLIGSLVFVAAFVAASFSFLQVHTERNRLYNELERRAGVLSDSLSESVEMILKTKDMKKLKRLVEKIGGRERLLGIVVFDTQKNIISATPDLPKTLEHPLAQIDEAVKEYRSIGVLEKADHKTTYLYLTPLKDEENELGSMMLIHDATYIDARLKGIWQHNFFRLLILTILIVITTLLVIRWNITDPITQVADWIKQLRMGGSTLPPKSLRGDILGPLASEVSKMAKSLASARAAAEKEAQLRLSAESVWTPEKLKEHVRNRLGESVLYLVSNREPYMHVRQKKKTECIVPASGVVTALEPVMRACGGLWVAHGAGDADRETCDKHGKLRVPPDEPAYTLKRIWLTKEEESGHYYGFSNEGLWPLCHITHTRPTFRLEDWVQYQKVNQKFADSILEEIGDDESPFILIQDYHFALLPLLIREKCPKARIALFWHIPWPNPEAFGICPWKQEIILGMLSADIVGFHIQYHCNNFLDTVDDTLESKINWENFSVERGGHVTQVRPFPISVSGVLEAESEAGGPPKDKKSLLDQLQKDYGIHAETLGVGVDRLDYTKGIVERFRAIERFFEKYPEWVGRFSFTELGAPSRTHIQKYQDFVSDVEKTADAINWRFQTKEWKPIHLLKAHHSHRDIQPFYKTADLCLVTSLHDGMNLVAKEYISAREDEDGVLILSQFTGASRELKDALIVNPYDIETTAESIRTALEMGAEERRGRMKKMRAVVQERNIYRWAANLVTDISKLPDHKTNPSPA